MCLCNESDKVQNWMHKKMLVKMAESMSSHSSFPLRFFLILIGFLLVTPIHGYRVLSREPLPGCYHNGTRYGDGSMVPTMEPCLSCKCSNRILTCALKVCPEQPVPPPRGCVLVQPKRSCCPHMQCRKYNIKPMTDSDRRIVNFLDDYESEQKIIQEKYGELSDGNSNFLRRSESTEDQNDNICIQNGTIYMPGSAMTSSSLCSYCYCIGGKQRCMKPKCLLPALADCTPIFIESNCCPVRYDCSERKSLKADNPPRKKITNKHYLRNSTMMARGTGCFVNGILYIEGHRLPKDPENPCEICYCIRGKRKCTPQKCSPEIRNCIPMIPKGQCCPSSYNCDTQEEKGRQFDLFSILFGDDDVNATEAIGEDDIVGTTILPGVVPSTTEKSFFDVLREGLEFVDAQEEKVDAMLNKNGTKVKSNSTNAVFEILDIHPESDTYYDYEDDEVGKNKTHLNATRSSETTTYAATTFDDKSEISRVVATTSNDLAENRETSTITEESSTIGDIESPTSTISIDTTDVEVQTTEVEQIITTTISVDDTKVPINLTTNRPTLATEVTQRSDGSTEISTMVTELSTEAGDAATTTDLDTTSEASDQTTEMEKADTKNGDESILLDNELSSTVVMTSTTTENILSALFNGLASILDKDSNKVKNITNSSSTAPTYFTKNVTTMISIDRIDENISTTDVSPALTPKPPSETAPEPIVIDSNPSILEADYHYDYSEPTLPPSLPNLKIIPFLPADAVKNDRKKVVPPFEYYAKHDPTLYPPVAVGEKRIDYAPTYTQENFNYDPTAYPSITESFDGLNYDYSAEGEKHSIIGYGNYAGVIPVYKNSPAAEFEGEAPIFNYEQMKGFSPPRETEGGFVPKEPIKDNFYYDTFRTTNFVVDLTTEIPPPNPNSILSPDPFKNVIRTEPPPDLHSLIEDKEKLLLNRVIINGTVRNDFDREIISITTDGAVTDDDGASIDEKLNGTKENAEEIVRENVTEGSKVARVTTTPAPGGFFDGIFGFLFKDDPQEEELATVRSTTEFELPTVDYDTMKVPEFKNLSKEVEIPEILLNTTDVKEKPSDNATVIRDILIDLLGDDAAFNATEKIPTTTQQPHNRLSVPYLAPAVQVNGGNNPIRSTLDLVIPELHKNDEDSVNDNFSPDSYQSVGDAQIFTKPTISSVQDPAGILKLAGCNIYGRMYRVGRIISELSGPCLECKCTEVGVHCTPLSYIWFWSQNRKMELSKNSSVVIAILCKNCKKKY
ncbi:uncharacterized protein LOC129790129 [Lutzomyia longipalpis]|uniref:uncharacterized protein LOC129790129 n=1 Tax=Lutzomyia longipalpis TaxID=7200 RepID=UPI002483A5ED|nr:uncharacterized protein LOC129790129 [Lutzomyia longipalpis]